MAKRHQIQGPHTLRFQNRNTIKGTPIRPTIGARLFCRRQVPRPARHPYQALARLKDASLDNSPKKDKHRAYCNGRPGQYQDAPWYLTFFSTKQCSCGCRVATLLLVVIPIQL